MTEPIPPPAGPGDRPPPARFAYDAHTWKEIAHLLSNLPESLVGFVYTVTALDPEQARALESHERVLEQYKAVFAALAK